MSGLQDVLLGAASTAAAARAAAARAAAARAAAVRAAAVREAGGKHTEVGFDLQQLWSLDMIDAAKLFLLSGIEG